MNYSWAFREVFTPEILRTIISWLIISFFISLGNYFGRFLYDIRKRNQQNFKSLNKYYNSSGSNPKTENFDNRLKKINKFLIKNKELPIIKGENRIEDFICFNPDLIQHLNRIIDDINRYIANPAKMRPLIVFLYASPGSGKTTLVRNIIDYINKNPSIKTQSQLFFSDKEFSNEINLININNIHALHEQIIKKINYTKKKSKNLLPVLFFDEIDSQIYKWQPFKSFLPIMSDACLDSDSENKTEFKRSILIFASSIRLYEPEFINEYIRIFKSRKVSIFRKILFFFEKKLKASISNGFLCFNGFNEFCSWRNDLLHTYKSQPSILKCIDFFDRIDHFIYLPSNFDYFQYLDKRNEIYYADLENVYLINHLIKEKYFKNVKKIDKNVFIKLCAFIYGSRRDLDRHIFLSKIQVGEEEFTLNHLDENKRENTFYKKFLLDDLSFL